MNEHEYLAVNQHCAQAVGDIPEGECTYCHEISPLGSIMDVDHKFYHICGKCSDAMWE